MQSSLSGDHGISSWIWCKCLGGNFISTTSIGPIDPPFMSHKGSSSSEKVKLRDKERIVQFYVMSSMIKCPQSMCMACSSKETSNLGHLHFSGKENTQLMNRENRRLSPRGETQVGMRKNFNALVERMSCLSGFHMYRPVPCCSSFGALSFTASSSNLFVGCARERQFVNMNVIDLVHL